MAKGDKSQNTKNALALALKGLVREIPLRKISVRAVTQRAGVDRQTFYNHFETMDDLVVHLCRMCVSVSSADTMRCQSSAELFRLLISQVEKNREVFAVLLKGVGRNALREVFHDDAKQALLQQARALLTGASARCAEGGSSKVGVFSELGANRGNAKSTTLEFAVEYCLLASASVLVEWLSGTIAATADELSVLLARAFEQQIRGFAAVG